VLKNCIFLYIWKKWVTHWYANSHMLPPLSPWIHNKFFSFQFFLESATECCRNPHMSVWQPFNHGCILCDFFCVNKKICVSMGSWGCTFGYTLEIHHRCAFQFKKLPLSIFNQSNQLLCTLRKDEILCLHIVSVQREEGKSQKVHQMMNSL
jgi:hypothetical protein